jgi:ParB family chromosome partitioning protein
VSEAYRLQHPAIRRGAAGFVQRWSVLLRKAWQHMEREVAAKPRLIQISTNWGSRSEGAVLGRNRYGTLSLSTKKNAKQPRSPYQKPCKHMAEAILVESTERGQTVKVCAEPNCAVHFADRRTTNPEQLAKEREQRRTTMEQQKLEVTVRDCVLAEVLKQVSAPLERHGLIPCRNAHAEQARTFAARVHRPAAQDGGWFG